MISIVVPTRGRTSLLRLLSSVAEARASYVSGGAGLEDVEVVVVVDTSCASVDQVRALLSSLSWQPTILASGGPGVNSARNLGAEQSRGDVLWFLDDDVEVSRSSAVADIASIFENADVIAAGGDYLSGPEATWIERGYNALCSAWRASAGRSGGELLLGGSLAVRREAWKAVGGFDASIDYGGAETPFVLRLHTLGRGVFPCRKLDVYHHPGSRGILQWWRVASRQGRRRSETAWSLPSLPERFARTSRFLSVQSRKTVICLFVFALPFLMVSVVSRLFLVRPARSARPIEEPRR